MAATAPADSSVWPVQNFVFGLLGFIAVAVLIEQYDNEHGTSWLWVYTLIIGLGIAVRHPAPLTKGLADIQAATIGNYSGPAPASASKSSALPNNFFTPNTGNVGVGA